MEIKAKRGDLLATLYWTQSIVERRIKEDPNMQATIATIERNLNIHK